MFHTPLVKAFLAVAPEEFKFLTTAHGQTLTLTTFEEWAVALRYTGRDAVVVVAYEDDRDQNLSVAVGPCTSAGQPGVMYGLSEWLDAFGVRERRMTGAAGLWRPESIQRVASESAAVLADFLPRIVSAGADVQATLARRREEYMRIRDLPFEQQRTR